MKKSLLILSFGMTLITNSWATDCTINPESKVMDVVSAQGGNHQINCQYVEDVQNIILKVQEFSEDLTPVNILVRRSHNNASFDGGLNLEIPQQLVFSGNYGQEYGTTVASNLTVVAHEYGHALLQNKIDRELSKKFPVVKEYMRLHTDLSQLEVAVAKNPHSKEMIDLLSKKYELLKYNLPMTKFFVLHSAYSELYADVVAAFRENNKDAVLNALYYDSMSNDAFMGIQARSFDSSLTPKHEKFMTDSHGYFAYTRNYIGKNLWPLNNEEKKIYLKKIGDAIVAELASLLKSKSELPHYKLSNKSLIKRLKKKS